MPSRAASGAKHRLLPVDQPDLRVVAERRHPHWPESKQRVIEDEVKSRTKALPRAAPRAQRLACNSIHRSRLDVGMQRRLWRARVRFHGGQHGSGHTTRGGGRNHRAAAAGGAACRRCLRPRARSTRPSARKRCWSRCCASWCASWRWPARLSRHRHEPTANAPGRRRTAPPSDCSIYPLADRDGKQMTDLVVPRRTAAS